jgi:hypothetical protein
MCAVMILPTRAMSHASVQQGTDYARISADGYRWREALGVVWPRNKYLYLGLPVSALAAWGAIARESPLSRAQRAVFVGLALYAFAMMFGDHSWLYRIAYHVVPGVSAFRSPPRYSAILGAATAVLAAAGVARLPWPRTSSVVTAIAIVAVACFALPESRDFREGPPPGSDARWSSLRARMGDVENQWRVLDEFGVGLRAGTRHGARDFRGYQDPLLDARYVSVLLRLGDAPQLLPQFNVRYLLRGPHFLHGEGHHFLPVGTESRIADDRGDGLWEVREPLPAAFWVNHAEIVANREAALDRLVAAAPRAVCLIERADAASEIASETSSAWHAASAVSIRRNDAEVDIDAPSDGWLVLNESYAPEWEATVDGASAGVVRANLVARAVAVRAGRHHVVFTYGARSDRRWLWLALVSAVLATAMAFARRR